MIDYELYCKIRDYQQNRHLTARQIARELHLHPETVARWLAADKFCPRKRSPRPSKLDPFKKQIVRWLESHPYTATQILQRLRESGYGGGISIVKEYVHQVRPPQAPAFLTLTFAPGECAQVDWGQFGSIPVGNTSRRLSFFVMVLCHSRMMYVEFTVSETMEHFLAAHANAFAFFGGVPARCMVDNLKSAVLQRAIGEAPVLNPRYKDFADHFGFAISPCGVGQAHEKGRVENAVGYVKKNFLAGLNPTDFCQLNPAARQWMESIANIRLHGSTKRRPAELFETERPALRPLPPRPYDLGVILPARASSQFRVRVDTNTYSVPAEYASAALMLKLYPDCLCVYHQDKLIARHLRRYDRHQDFEDPDHPRELLQQRRKASDQKLLQRLLALSPRAQAFYQQLAERRLNVTHHVRKIVALSEIYGTEKTARAIADALEFEAFSCEYIANLLEQRQRLLPEAGALHLTRRADLLELELPEPNLSLYDTDDINCDGLRGGPADLGSSPANMSSNDLNGSPADPDNNPDGDPHEPGQE
jgi:transposase